MKKNKTQSGITLVALIITIIVLLILAIVSIRAIQQGGIIGKSQNAVNSYEDKRVEEENRITEYENLIDQYKLDKPGGNSPEGNPEEDLQYIQDYFGNKTLEEVNGKVDSGAIITEDAVWDGGKITFANSDNWSNCRYPEWYFYVKYQENYYQIACPLDQGKIISVAYFGKEKPVKILREDIWINADLTEMEWCKSPGRMELILRRTDNADYHPKKIRLEVNGVDLIENTDFTYDNTTGLLIIFDLKENVTLYTIEA